MTPDIDALVAKARQAISRDHDHMQTADAEELAWLAAQLVCYPDRVHPDKTTNLRFIMTSAAKILLDQATNLTALSDEIAVLTRDNFALTVRDKGWALQSEEQQAEIAVLKEREGWQPIGTAPKDGSEILAYSEHGCTGTMLVRHIAPDDFLTAAEAAEWVQQGMSETCLATEDWFVSDFLSGSRLSPDCYPTHWRPLPDPPALTDKAGSK